MDILTPAADENFPAILARAVLVMVGDLEVRVIGRDDLIAMKRVVVNKQESGSEKHKRDLDCLKRLKKVKPPHGRLGVKVLSRFILPPSHDWLGQEVYSKIWDTI